MGDKWSALIPNAIEHIKKQDVQGVTVMEPWVSPNTPLRFENDKMSKLEAITDRLNACIEHFYNKTDATHMWMIDSDIEVPRHALRYLLELDVDIASGIYPFHNEQFAMMFGKMRATGEDVQTTNMFTPRGLIGFPDDGVIGGDLKVGGGNGCMLMKRRVFDKYHPAINPMRFINNVERMGSDLYFWHRAQEAGFSCRIHGRVICGHKPQWPLESYRESYEKYGPKEWE